MALNFDTSKLDKATQRILAKAEAREKKPIIEMLARQSMNDIIRSVVYPALDKAIMKGEVPEAVADLVEAMD